MSEFARTLGPTGGRKLIPTERSVCGVAPTEVPEQPMTDETPLADESTEPSHGHYLTRWGDETPLYEAVTDGVSTVTGDARSAVAARYDRAHALALSRLFGGESESATPSTGVVKFVISECVVSVHSDGQLSVSPSRNGRDTVG